MQEFAASLDQKGLHVKTFQTIEKEYIQAQIDTCEAVLSDSVKRVIEVYAALGIFPDENGILNISVSYDGSWQKRGHTSNYGLGAVIEINTGLVINYYVVSKFCQSCATHQNKFGKGIDKFNEWYVSHEPYCQINYQGSSNAMEAEVAVRLWSRSISKHN